MRTNLYSNESLIAKMLSLKFRRNNKYNLIRVIPLYVSLDQIDGLQSDNTIRSEEDIIASIVCRDDYYTILYLQLIYVVEQMILELRCN